LPGGREAGNSTHFLKTAYSGKDKIPKEEILPEKAVSYDMRYTFFLEVSMILLPYTLLEKEV
jgi:hypothetical protein